MNIIQKNNVYPGKASELIWRLDPASVDLTITSPPYDNLREYNGFVFDWDEFKKVVYGLWRATKPRGVVVWIVADETKDGSESGTSFKQALYFMDAGFNLFDTMIYKVDGTGAKGSHYHYFQEFEYMFVFSKEGRPKTINKIKDRVNKKAGARIGPSKKSDSMGVRIKGDGNHIIEPYGFRGNVWEYHAGANGDDPGDHPAPFPEDLARDHIITWSDPGDLILDPFCGSGTTPKMAKALKRDWIGFDISEEYCISARARIEASSLPLLEILEEENRKRTEKKDIPLPGFGL